MELTHPGEEIFLVTYQTHKLAAQHHFQSKSVPQTMVYNYFNQTNLQNLSYKPSDPASLDINIV